MEVFTIGTNGFGPKSITGPPFRTHAAYLRERFGERVHRIALDGGFGCPHREDGRGPGGCIFCSSTGSGSGAHDRGLTISEQMQAGIKRLEKTGIRKVIAYFQAFCGTGAEPEVLERLYLEALSFPGVVGLTVGTRPDMVPDQVLRLLAGLAKQVGSEKGDIDLWLELGLQSASNDTLKRIQRGHDVASFDDAVKRAGALGISTAAHVILGLPGEDDAQMMATADHLSRLPVQGVKLHHLYVEAGTALATQYEKGAFETLSEARYMELAIGFIRRLKPDIVLMRLAGRGNEERLIAPRWKMAAGSLAQAIAREMEGRGNKQGDLVP